MWVKRRRCRRTPYGLDCATIVEIVRKVWQKAPFGKLQALPKDAEPVANWSNRDKAWTNVADGIEKVVEELRLRRR